MSIHNKVNKFFKSIDVQKVRVYRDDILLVSRDYVLPEGAHVICSKEWSNEVGIPEIRRLLFSMKGMFMDEDENRINALIDLIVDDNLTLHQKVHSYLTELPYELVGSLRDLLKDSCLAGRGYYIAPLRDFIQLDLKDIYRAMIKIGHLVPWDEYQKVMSLFPYDKVSYRPLKGIQLINL